MNALITQYKKIALLAVAVVAMNGNVTVLAECSPCAAASAARSAAAAQAALIAMNKLIAREAELDKVPVQDAARAPHAQLLFDPFKDCQPVECCAPNTCDLNSKLQTLFNCCVSTNQMVQCQGQEAEKCCKKLRHKIDDVEDQTIVIENLIISQTDAAATCCDAITTLIGDPAVTIPSFQDCSINVLNYVNTNNDDVLTWLKRLYVLMYQVFSCTCCNF